jgi:hypothetical protein
MGRHLPGRRKPVPGACGKNFLCFCIPASRRKPVVCHCAVLSLLRASPGHTSMYARETHASHPWQTPLGACAEPLFFTPRSISAHSNPLPSKAVVTTVALAIQPTRDKIRTASVRRTLFSTVRRGIYP